MSHITQPRFHSFNSSVKLILGHGLGFGGDIIKPLNRKLPSIYPRSQHYQVVIQLLAAHLYLSLRFKVNTRCPLVLPFSAFLLSLGQQPAVKADIALEVGDAGATPAVNAENLDSFIRVADADGGVGAMEGVMLDFTLDYLFGDGQIKLFEILNEGHSQDAGAALAAFGTQTAEIPLLVDGDFEVFIHLPGILEQV